jgi:hypothetical protein
MEAPTTAPPVTVATRMAFTLVTPDVPSTGGRGGTGAAGGAAGDGLAATLLAAFDPVPNYTRLLDADQTVALDAAGQRPQRSSLHPITATPRFDGPMVERLRRLDEQWVCGGVDDLEDDSLSLMVGNRRFVEALLAGANHELVRELRWRGYPVDVRGASFLQFWPSAGGDVADVAPLRDWTARLGHNQAGGPDQPITILLVKSELLRRYPSTIITLELGRRVADRFATARLAPELFRGVLDADAAYLAFGADATVPLHSQDGDGNQWFVSLRQPLDESHFGLDDFVPATPGEHASNAGKPPAAWTWQGRADPSQPFLVPAEVAAGAAPSSAGIAANLLRRPFRLLLPATEFVAGAS